MKTNANNNIKESSLSSQISPLGTCSVNGSPMNRATLLVALALCSLPAPGRAQLTPATASGRGPGAYDTSTLNPNVGNNNNPPPNAPAYFTGQCPWITSTMNTFVGNNANYTYQWAVPTFNLQADLSVSPYYAWVNTSPTNPINGFSGPFKGDVVNNDVGGAAFGLTYTPTAAGSPTNIFFIQSIQEIETEGGTTTTNFTLDNSGSTPWYGGLTSSATNAGSSSRMADIPYAGYVNGSTSIGNSFNWQFQDVIAVDNVVGGTNNLTLYQGEEWWGFNLTLTPEPPTGAFAGLSLLLFLAARSIRRWRSRPSA